MIRVADLHKWFGKLHVLRGISCSVSGGEVVVVCGPSGSGKSTLLRCINALEQPASGEIRVDGLTVTGRATKNVNQVRQRVGMVFQQFNLFPHLSVLENLMLAPTKVRKMAPREAEQVARALLARVGIPYTAASSPAMPDGRLPAFSSAMMSDESPAFAASGAWAYHSTCERHCRPMIRIANSLSFVGTEVSQRR